VSKVVRIVTLALVVAAILVLSVSGAVFAHNGNGAGDGTGLYSQCPDDCGDCTHDPHLYEEPGPHPAK
jgi:hypothetical protein